MTYMSNPLKNNEKTITKKTTKILLVTLLLSGLFGLIASFALTIETIKVISDPTRIPSCSISPIVSCTSAMISDQASIVGIPNSLFGIVAYTALITISVLLLAGIRLNASIWKLLITASVGGMLFMLYLLYVSLFNLSVICPWCFGIWVTTPLVFVSIIALYVRSEIGYPNSRILNSIAKRPVALIAAWYALLFSAILVVFWDYWSTLV